MPAAPDRPDLLLHDVEEVALVGDADPFPWARALRPARLIVHAVDDVVPVTLTASRAVFRGIEVSELVVTVPVSASADGSTADGAYLALGYQSFGVFAVVERRVFGTPFLHADVALDAGDRPSIEVRRNERLVLSARMEQESPEVAPGDDGWAGPVFLPPAGGRLARLFGGGGRVLLEQREGPSRRMPVHAPDTIDFGPGATHPVFDVLRLSGFTPMHWQVRTGARHARSRSRAR